MDTGNRLTAVRGEERGLDERRGNDQPQNIYQRSMGMDNNVVMARGKGGQIWDICNGVINKNKVKFKKSLKIWYIENNL